MTHHRARLPVGGRALRSPASRPAGTVAVGSEDRRGALVGAAGGPRAKVAAGMPPAAATATAGPAATATTSRGPRMSTDTDEVPAGVQVREINGTPCTDRAGIAVILDRAPITVELLGFQDPEFPAPVPTSERVGRDWRHQWTPLADVYAYRDQLAARAEQHKPAPSQVGGDPDELVGWTALAGIWRTADGEPIAEGTAKRYVYRARPQWAERHPHPLVPVPDRGYDPDRPAASSLRDWQWYRRTLAEHPRPGRGSSGGRKPRARKTT